MTDKKREDVEKVLREEILEEARRKGDGLAKRAQEEAKILIEHVEREAEAVRAQVLKDAERRIARLRQVSDSGLVLRTRMRRLNVQGQLLDEVFSTALTRLSRSHRDAGFDYGRVLKDLAVEAALAVGSGEMVLRLGQADLGRGEDSLALAEAVVEEVRRKSGRTVRLTVPMDRDASGPIEGGVIVESADGRERFDNSFGGRLSRLEDELRFEVADVLFGKSADAGTPGKETGS